ncbi:hypothetical protein T492DRAFT_897029, partial [Pavlovales sp. CCMP2436]
MAEGGPSSERPRGAVEAAFEAALARLLRTLASDPLRAILKLLVGVDLTCARLACRDFLDHSSPAQEAMPRSGFLRTRTLAMFAWDYIPGFVLDLSRMLRLAASVGCVGVLEKLVDNLQCELTASACAAAAKNGQLGALTWLRSRGCPWDHNSCRNSAAGGHLEVLRYAHEHGCPWNIDTCCYAAGGGHLEVLRYAHEHSCLWDRKICAAAAGEGHLEVLRYALEHGCPIHMSECLEVAELNGHVAVVEYLYATEEVEEHFMVEAVVALRVTEDGGIEYRVLWQGYPEVDPTWRSTADLANCTDLIAQFESEGRKRKPDALPVVSKSNPWIIAGRSTSALNDSADGSAERTAGNAGEGAGGNTLIEREPAAGGADEED